jgi:hypothetical protein
MVKIQDHFIPVDFMVLDMGDEEEDTPIILGRPFLNTTDAIIYIGSEQLHLQFPDEKVRYHFNSYTNYEQPKKPCSNRRRRRSRRQANQPLKDGWTDYPGEVSRYEDRYCDQDDKLRRMKQRQSRNLARMSGTKMSMRSNCLQKKKLNYSSQRLRSR